MAEYIEREAVFKAYMDLLVAKSKLAKAQKGAAFFRSDLLPETELTDKEWFRLISAAPSADVAPVVRCRECKYRGDYDCPMYHEEYYWDEDDGGDYIPIDNTHDDGFCDMGERKGDDD